LKADVVEDIEVYTVQPRGKEQKDFGWASPDCKSFTRTSDRGHSPARSLEGKALTARAKKGDSTLLATVRYFQEMERINPDFLWVIENPKGYMRKQEIMEPSHLHTVSYCKYGLTVQKHTDLFSNMKFSLAPPCDGKCGAPEP
jgi:hypothetical protein